MFIIEGNIGVGKSTFLKMLAEHTNAIMPIFEPVQQWQTEVEGKSILSEFYHNPHRWAFTMETIAMASRVQDYLEQQKDTEHIKVMERSLYSGHYVFALNDYRAGYLTELEWHVYQQWFATLTKQCLLPSGFIYLRVDPAIAQKRIIKRSRHGEEPIALAYLEQIHQRHDAFLLEKENVPAPLNQVPVLTLDCNIDFESRPDYGSQMVEQAMEFIKSKIN